MGDERVKEEALQILGLFQVLPRLVVFDLDYTLWPFYCQPDVGSQKMVLLSGAKRRFAVKIIGLTDLFVSQTHNIECRSKREMPDLYPHAKGIVHALKTKGIDVAIASRSPTPDIAKAFLNKLDLQSMFVAQEIFSSWTHKTEHFERIRRRTGVHYKSMLFFDDEYRNIEAVSKMGATCILVDNGVNLEMLRVGLRNFAHNFSSPKTKQSD